MHQADAPRARKQLIIKQEAKAVDEYNEQLKLAAIKLQEFVDAIEPVFQAGHEKYQPNTDWWCIIAGIRHVAVANVRWLHTVAKEPFREVSDTDSDPVWKQRILGQRKRAVFESEIEGPCEAGCMLTWRNQYAYQEHS